MAGRMRPTFIVECYDERDAGEDDVGAVVELKDIVIVPCDSTAVLICPKRVNDGADSSLCKGVGAALGLNADRPSRKSCGTVARIYPLCRQNRTQCSFRRLAMVSKLEVYAGSCDGFFPPSNLQPVICPLSTRRQTRPFFVLSYCRLPSVMQP